MSITEWREILRIEWGAHKSAFGRKRPVLEAEIRTQQDSLSAFYSRCPFSPLRNVYVSTRALPTLLVQELEL